MLKRNAGQNIRIMGLTPGAHALRESATEGIERAQPANFGLECLQILLLSD
jgi:hypothetical protein